MDKLDRRGLLGRGAALAGAPLAFPGGASLAAQVPATGPSFGPPIGTVRTVATRDMLRSLRTVEPGDILYLTEPGREGVFACRQDV